MERSHGVSSSAAQPASKRSKPSTNPSGGASGSAAQPATLLEQVEQLGHYPKRCKKPVTDKELAENSLAIKIAKEWSNLSDTTRAELTRLKQPATLLEQVEARKGNSSAASFSSAAQAALSEVKSNAFRTFSVGFLREKYLAAILRLSFSEKLLLL